TYDPEAACNLPVSPHATYIEYPFHIILGGNDHLLIIYQYASANRVVEMLYLKVPPIDSWLGTSYGRGDGDTLEGITISRRPGDVTPPGGVMEPTGVTWPERLSNYLTNAATVTERFTPMGPNHIQYTATIEDPSIYTRPWKISMPLYRRMEPNAQLLEFRCVPFSEMLLYGDLLESSPDRKSTRLNSS